MHKYNPLGQGEEIQLTQEALVQGTLAVLINPAEH